MAESSQAEQLFKNPSHPYTSALLKAIPQAGQGRKKDHEILTGDIPSPINPPSGCYFHPRCPDVFKQCELKTPTAIDIDNNQHLVSCLKFNEENKP
jgi:oligopeptide/dipeptide ABC transporter ATP-binding protein